MLIFQEEGLGHLFLFVGHIGIHRWSVEGFRVLARTCPKIRNPLSTGCVEKRKPIHMKNADRSVANRTLIMAAMLAMVLVATMIAKGLIATTGLTS